VIAPTMTEPSRRRFIALGISGTHALAVSGGLFRWLRAGYVLAPGEVAIALSAKELCVARSLVDALAPGGEGWPGGVALGLHQRVDEQVWAADTDMARDLRAALQLLEHVPPLLGHYGRFSSLSREARVDVFERLLDSHRDVLAQVAVGLKQLVQMLYYAEDAVWPHIGYDGPWIQERKPPDSALAYAEIFRQRGGKS
jgi:hypothetical protein